MRGESDALTRLSAVGYDNETQFPVRGRLGSGEARRENRARESGFLYIICSPREDPRHFTKMPEA